MESSLVWFRNDLRVADNHSLKAACDGGKPVIAVYFFDPVFYEKSDFGFKDLPFEIPFTKTGKYRAQFIIEAVVDLKAALAKHNIPLLVYHDSPQYILPKFIEKFGVTDIYLQKEWTRDELEQEEKLGKALENLATKPKGHRVYDQFLFHPDHVPYRFDKIPQVFTEFRKKCEKESKVMPLVGIDNFNQSKIEVPETTIPTLSQLGLDTITPDNRSAFPWKGGEASGWERIQHYFWETEKLKFYKKTRNGLIGIDYSSKLSAWLGIGCISARQVYHEVKRFEKEIAKNQDTYWLIFELIWRDFFKYTSLKYEDNIFKLGGILNHNYEWKRSARTLEKWISGDTHEPFVNANMKELAATGWMSNRGRQNVASYWSMHQEQDWRIGAAYFEHILIDYDVHSNYGNWMYNSGVGNDPRNRTFNIARQASNYDGQNKYQDLWLKERLF